MKIRHFVYVSLCLLSLVASCTRHEKFIMFRQVTGGIDTNCYLLYGEKSREAALFDVAGAIDSLLQIIAEKELKVKYLICTHGHFDHVVGLPAIKKMYPEAKVCLHRDDYKDMFKQKAWATENLGQEFIDYLLEDPERKKIYDFDVASFGEPDIFVEDNQILKLGYGELKTIHCPGHSPGSVCYAIDDMLFSGDVLFYRSVGRVDVQNGSKEDQIKSVRRLYDLLPDETKVYPGHGQFTDIGAEKRENKYVTVNEVHF